jgi:hypothetical protein
MARARRSASLCGLTTFDPVEDEIANALADLHFRDPLERKGVGHLDVDGIEPGIDHLHRPVGESRAARGREVWQAWTRPCRAHRRSSRRRPHWRG